MSNTASSSSGGVGFVGLLTILFVALKLTGVIHWSWWWVLAPLWITALLTVLAVVAVGVVLFRGGWDRRRSDFYRSKTWL